MSDSFTVVAGAVFAYGQKVAEISVGHWSMRAEVEEAMRERLEPDDYELLSDLLAETSPHELGELLFERWGESAVRALVEVLTERLADDEELDLLLAAHRQKGGTDDGQTGEVATADAPGEALNANG